MKRFISIVLWALLYVFIFLCGYLSGCQTMNGLGRDLQKVTEPYSK
jgi:predicted small secreted protein